MKKTPIAEFKDLDIKSELNNIPFFSDLSMNHWDDHDALMKNAEIIELEPKDVLIEKDNTDRVFYFLLKGNLAVYATKEVSKDSVPVTVLGPGQVLGALTILTGLPRTATVAVERDAGPALVFSCDFSVFGELNDYSNVSLTTKLVFFRIVINNTRFKLDTYKKKSPDHPFANIYADLPRYSGERGGEEELKFYYEQAPTLTKLLEQWNQKQ